MKYRFLTKLVTSLMLLCTLVVPISAARAAELLSLEQAVAMALASNPSLAAIEARAQALATVPDQSGALPDPSLSLNLVNLPLDSFSFTQEAMTQFQIGISQVLPYPGKLALRSQMATQEADSAKSDVHEKRLQLIRDVKTVWWNFFYLDRALEVVARNQNLLGQTVQVSETRYRVGQGQQQDILLAQLELTKLRDVTLRLLNMRDNEAARLNLLLDRSTATPFQLPAKVDEALPILTTAASLQERARELRPTLAAQQRLIDAARSRVDLAKKEYFPEFKVGAVYGLRGGTNPDGSSRADFGSFIFSMSLPLYASSKQDRAVDQRNAEFLQKKYQLHDQRNQVAAEVQQALTDYQRAAEQAQLFSQEIIPQARQTVDAMLAGYQVGKVDFLSLLRSQTTLYDYESQYWKALSVAHQAHARLVAAVGEDNIYE